MNLLGMHTGKGVPRGRGRGPDCGLLLVLFGVCRFAEPGTTALRRRTEGAVKQAGSRPEKEVHP